MRYRLGQVASMVLLGGQPAVADTIYSDPQPTPLPGWVQAIDHAITWLSSFAPSGAPSDAVSSFLYVLIGAAVGALPTAIIWAQRRWARRAERIAADETLRKLDTKKVNEHIKLLGSLCNTVGAAIVGAAFIVPYIGNHMLPAPDQTRWIIAGAVIPMVGHFALRFMKSEG